MDIVFDGQHVFQKCLGCSRYETDGIQVVGMITGMTGALQILNDVFSQRFGLKLPEELNDAIEQEEHHAHIKRQLLQAGQAVLSAGISQTGGEFAYVQDAVHYLRRRGLDMSSLHVYGLGVFPTLKHFADYADVNILPDVHEYLGPKVFDAKPMAPGHYGGWVMFPYHLTTTTIGRLKLRNPNDKTQEMWLGRHTKEPRGFFGLHLSAMHVGAGTDQSKTAYVVEGEFDQLSLVQAQVRRNANDHYTVVAASGAGASDIDYLGESSIRDVVLMGDNDAGGISFVKNALRNASQSMVKNVSVYHWDAPFDAFNDPDDIVVAGQYAPFWDSVTSRTSVLELSDWAARRVLADVATMHMPRTIQKIDAVNDYGQLISDEVVRDLFVKNCAVSLKLDHATLAKHVVRNDSPKGFRLNLERSLLEYVVPVASVGSGKALLYSKTDEEIFEVTLKHPRDIELAFQSRVFHMTTFEFIEAKVGIPDWIAIDETKKGTQERTEESQVSKVKYHFDWSVQNLVSQAVPLSHYNVRKQGIHWADAAEDPIDRERLPADCPDQRIYIVNGSKMFMGTAGDDAETVLTPLTEPMHGAYLLWGERGTGWSSNVHNLESMEQMPPMGIIQCYEMLTNILNIGWEFKNHDLCVQYLAANLLTISCGMVFEYLPFTFFTGGTHSGKSTILKGLVAGVQPKELAVLEHVKMAEDYTAAGVMQSASGSSLLYALDEWEDPDTTKTTSKSRSVQSLLEMTRNLSTGMTRTRGSVSGQASSVYLRFPIMAAGIVPHQEQVDLNRWFTIEMNKNKNREAPEVLVSRVYSQQDIANLRKSLTLHAIQNAFYLKELEAKVYHHAFNGGIVPLPSTRYVKALLSTMVGLHWVGEDEMTFGKEFIRAAELYISNTNVTEERRMFQAVFETNAIRLEQHPTPQSAVAILAAPELRDQLSGANVGLYHAAGTDVVAIYCAKLPAILQHHPNYRTTSNTHQIHSLLARNPEIINDPTFLVKNPSIFQHIRQYTAHPRPEEFLYIKLSSLSFSLAPLADPPLDDKDVI
jgi:DNA primase